MESASRFLDNIDPTSSHHSFYNVLPHPLDMYKDELDQWLRFGVYCFCPPLLRLPEGYCNIRSHLRMRTLVCRRFCPVVSVFLYPLSAGRPCFTLLAQQGFTALVDLCLGEVLLCTRGQTPRRLLGENRNKIKTFLKIK